MYAIEATVYAADLGVCYKELARVLKPGGIFGNYEWHLTQAFNPKNDRHIKCKERVERGDGRKTSCSNTVFLCSEMHERLNPSTIFFNVQSC